MTGFSPAVVERIWTRDQGCCARCGRSLRREARGVEWSVHHRCPRSSGGTRRSWVGEAANGVLLCGTGTTGCHGVVEREREQARADGWLVSANGRLLADEVAVRHVLFGLVLLTDEGWFAPVEEGPTPESIDLWKDGA